MNKTRDIIEQAATDLAPAQAPAFSPSLECAGGIKGTAGQDGHESAASAAVPIAAAWANRFPPAYELVQEAVEEGRERGWPEDVLTHRAMILCANPVDRPRLIERWRRRKEAGDAI